MTSSLLSGLAARLRPVLRGVVMAVGLLGLSSPVVAQSVSVNGVASPAGVTVPAGSSLSVGVTGATTRFDWVTLATVGSANTTYVTWMYLNGSQTAPASTIANATLTIALPFGTTAYEVRLFANNGYTRLATSGVITPAWPTNTTVSIDGALAPDRLYPAHGASTVVEVANASGSPTDWLGLYDVGAEQLVTWKYLNNSGTPPSQGVVTASLPWVLPTTRGTYEFRLWANGSSTTRLGTSPRLVIEYPITVNDTPRPNLAYVGATSGASVTVQGPGNLLDWVGLYVPGAADTAYLNWQYLDGQQTAPTQARTAATLTFPLPGPGRYEFRFFANNIYTRLAISDPVVATCVSGATPGTVDAAAGVESHTLSVSAQAGCAWTATSPAGMATVTSGATGEGSRSVTMALSAHTGTAARTGVLDLGGREVPITQQKAGLSGLCATVSPSTLSVGAQGGLSTVAVTADAACAWASVSASSFVHVTRGLRGTGGRSVSVLVTPNTSESARTATVYVAGTAVTVTQASLPKTPQPQLTLAPGTYHANQVVNVTAASGATVRYTTSGATPSVTDPVWPGSLLVDQSTTVTVRAWQTGLLASDPVAATYELQVPPMNLNPPSGGYAPPVTVSMNAVPGATVRYTLDGSTPTATSTLYAGPFTVTASATVSARAFKPGWSPSVPAVSTIATVLTPVLSSVSPLTGPTGSVISLTGLHFGATQGTSTVRFNGVVATPIAWSATRIFVHVPVGATPGPITVTAGGQVSNGVGFAVTPDTEGPTITATYSSDPNAAGWHRTPVTVSFTCSDASTIASCPSPVLFDQAGIQPPFTVTATDSLGNQGSLVLNVRIDPTAPDVTLTAPTDGLTTTASAVTVAAQIGDTLSGVTSATCNGTPAVVNAGAIACTVSLQPGVNAVVVAAHDAAGNSASRGARVTRTGTPTTIRVTPQTRALVVGEAFAFTAVSAFGVVPDVVWTSSHPAILSVAADGSGVVTGESAGEATLTASLGGLTAQATVTVGVSALAPGAVRWTGPVPAPGTFSSSMIPAHRVNNEGPDLFTVDAASATGPHTVRSLTADGRLVRTETTAVTPLFGDAHGGLIGLSADATTLARLATPGTQLPWAYRTPSGPLAGGNSLYGPAQSPDGTVHVIEYRATTAAGAPGGGYNSEADVVGLNGLSGTVAFRAPLPATTWTVSPTGCTTGLQNYGGSAQTYDSRSGAATSPITIGSDGEAYLLVEESHLVWSPTCADVPFFGELGEVQGTNNRLQSGQGTREWQKQLWLWRVTSAGAVTSTLIYDWQHTEPDTELNGGWPAAEYAYPVSVTPDSLGGVLAVWTRMAADGSETKHVTRINAGGTLHDVILPDPQAEILLTGDSGTAYYRTPTGPLTAVDVTTWTQKWTTSASGAPVMALVDGGVALHDPSTSALTLVDATGNSTSTGNLPLTAVTSALEYGRWLGLSTATGALAEVVGATPVEALFSFQTGKGNREGQNAATDLRQGIYAKAHYFRDIALLNARHISILIIPRNQDYWRAQEPNIFDKPVPGSAHLKFGTLGAGPVPGGNLACVNAVLHADHNRPEDWQQAPSMRPERLRHPLGAEDLWIQELIARHRTFAQHHNGELDYACPPITSLEDGWNSNGYAHGLLDAAGVSLPLFPSTDTWLPWPADPVYPGWQKPVPAHTFQVP